VDVDIPHEFLCPITHEIMHDPVLSSGKGNTFYASGVTDTHTHYWNLTKRLTPISVIFFLRLSSPTEFKCMYIQGY